MKKISKVQYLNCENVTVGTLLDFLDDIAMDVAIYLYDPTGKVHPCLSIEYLETKEIVVSDINIQSYESANKTLIKNSEHPLTVGDFWLNLSKFDKDTAVILNKNKCTSYCQSILYKTWTDGFLKTEDIILCENECKVQYGK